MRGVPFLMSSPAHLIVGLNKCLLKLVVAYVMYFKYYKQNLIDFINKQKVIKKGMERITLLSIHLLKFLQFLQMA